MKRKNVAEQMFSDMVTTLREKQDDLERAINEYTSNTPIKPSIDVKEDPDNITVKTDLPGVNKENIRIYVTDDTLEIKAQFEEELSEEGATYLIKERTYGEASRVIVLPAKIKIDETTSHFENGVLTIILPKLEKKESFEVKIE